MSVIFVASSAERKYGADFSELFKYENCGEMGSQIRKIGYFLLYALLFTFWGCEDPCTVLSKDICRCLESEVEQKACIQNVEDASDAKNLTQDEEDVCESLLETCSCEAVEQEQYALCGMAYES